MNAHLQVVEYVRADGEAPFRRWFDRLDALAAAKVSTALKRLCLGNLSSVKWFGGIGECRMDWGPGYRVYLTKDGERLLVLLWGGTKQRQQADVTRAKALNTEYRARKSSRTRRQ
jgi:putative addiction module killer protein